MGDIRDGQGTLACSSPIRAFGKASSGSSPAPRKACPEVLIERSLKETAEVTAVSTL